MVWAVTQGFYSLASPPLSQFLSSTFLDHLASQSSLSGHHVQAQPSLQPKSGSICSFFHLLTITGQIVGKTGKNLFYETICTDLLLEKSLFIHTHTCMHTHTQHCHYSTIFFSPFLPSTVYAWQGMLCSAVIFFRGYLVTPFGDSRPRPKTQPLGPSIKSEGFVVDHALYS